jgi:hypothetical protein
VHADKPSAPVTVTNPAASPVPTTVVNRATGPALTSSADDPGRIAYQSTNSTTCGAGTCGFSFPVVPAGHRLVIQHVSGELIFSGGTPTGVVATLFGRADNSPTFFSAPSISPPPGTPPRSAFDNSVLYYVDAGETPVVAADVFSAVFFFRSDCYVKRILA